MKTLSLGLLAATAFGFLVTNADAEDFRVAWIATNDFASVEFGELNTPLIKIDAKGNVYLGATSGRREADRILYDYVAVKRDRKGRRVWQSAVPVAVQGIPSAMELDRFGNVYMTGSGGTVKFYANGELAWAIPFGDAQGGWKAFQDIGVDSAGNVYVAGHSLAHPPSLSSVAITATKYDPHGQELWTRHYSGGLIYWDPSSQHLLVDRSDHVYVVGAVRRHIALSEEWAIIKYDGNGNEIWTRSYDGPGFDTPYDAALDRAGNLLVTGYDGGLLTMKYDPRGNLLWKTHQPAASYNARMALDQAGNVYVRGFYYDEETVSHSLVKLRSNGRHQWTVEFTTDFGWGRAFAVDRKGNAYLGVPSWDPNHPDTSAVVKFNPAGRQVSLLPLPQEPSTLAVGPDHGLFVATPGFVGKFLTRSTERHTDDD